MTQEGDNPDQPLPLAPQSGSIGPEKESKIGSKVSALTDRLKADCAACCGLCCVALPFDASPSFGFDKAANSPCPNLTSNHRCSIHDELLVRGFSGCAAYDCFGAGQWVVQRLFKGATWRDSPEVAKEMFEAFWSVRVLHELMGMLIVAVTRVGSEASRQALRGKVQEIETICNETLPKLKQVDLAKLKQEVKAVCRQLVVRND